MRNNCNCEFSNLIRSEINYHTKLEVKDEGISLYEEGITSVIDCLKDLLKFRLEQHQFNSRAKEDDEEVDPKVFYKFNEYLNNSLNNRAFSLFVAKKYTLLDEELLGEENLTYAFLNCFLIVWQKTDCKYKSGMLDLINILSKNGIIKKSVRENLNSIKMEVKTEHLYFDENSCSTYWSE